MKERIATRPNPRSRMLLLFLPQPLLSWIQFQFPRKTIPTLRNPRKLLWTLTVAKCPNPRLDWKRLSPRRHHPVLFSPFRKMSTKTIARCQLSRPLRPTCPEQPFLVTHQVSHLRTPTFRHDVILHDLNRFPNRRPMSTVVRSILTRSRITLVVCRQPRPTISSKCHRISLSRPSLLSIRITPERSESRTFPNPHGLRTRQQSLDSPPRFLKLPIRRRLVAKLAVHPTMPTSRVRPVLHPDATTS